MIPLLHFHCRRYIAHIKPANADRTSEAVQIASNTRKITIECLTPDTEYILTLTCRINGVETPDPIAVTKLATKPLPSKS